MEPIDFASLYQFDEIYLMDGETESVQPKLTIFTEWLVVGQEEDLPKISQILAAAPFQFTETHFTYLQTHLAMPIFEELLMQERVKNVVLLGEEFSALGLPQELGEHAGKTIYHFHRTICSLGDEEKDVKRMFWNQLKKML